MKSKSFDMTRDVGDKFERNKTFDCVNHTEPLTPQKKHKPSESEEKQNHDIKSESPKRERSPYKRNKRNKQVMELSVVSIDGPSGTSGAAGRGTPLNESRVTSTPLVAKKAGKADLVKSIMKNSSVIANDTMEESLVSPSKPKKRNKSVSFMLDDSEEITIKKTKSEANVASQPTLKAHKLKNIKKLQKHRQSEKENTGDDNNQTMDVEQSVVMRKEKKSKDKQETGKTLLVDSNVESGDTPNTVSENNQEKKKRKHTKKPKKQDEQSESKPPENKESDKPKKAKKKKRETKTLPENDNEEPASKSRKKEIKPEVIAEDLENLSIGDNAHTLTNLLDEMTVADKNKQKKLRKRASKGKKEKETDSKSSEEVKEKKWKRRRWNKESRLTKESLATSVTVENLPLDMLFNYKKVLTEHFAKCGLLRNVGIAEVYPTEVSTPVFTTTIYFDNEEAASKALEEDKTLLEGSKIRVKRPLPPTETTAVVRTYGQLTEQGVSSAFHGAGRIRSIRITAKGKKSMSTAFVEFDGPESVEKAIKMASEVKIGGKKIHVAKFETRKKKVEKSADKVSSEGEHSDDSNNQ